MERILRSVIQVGNKPESEDALRNWLVLREYDIDFYNEEDHKIFQYLETFYDQMSAPPDFGIIREFFEKKDDTDTATRLDEIKNSISYIRTNFLAIVRTEQEQQLTKKFLHLCREGQTIAEHGRNLEKPVNGKKVIRGVHDAINYIYEKMSNFTRIEGGEKLEGVISEDAEEVLDEHDLVSKTNKYQDRNLFGFEPVDNICKGHRAGEYWIHLAFAGELKCLSGKASVYDHNLKRRRTIKEVYESKLLPKVTSLYKEGKENHALTIADCSYVMENGVRSTYELTLESGKQTWATDNHRFFTLNGWKELKDIDIGEWIAVPKMMNVDNPSTDFSDSEVKVIGYLLGDGTVSREIVLTATNEHIRDDFSNCLREMGCKEGYSDFKIPYFRSFFPDNRAAGVRVSQSYGDKWHHCVSPVRHLLERLGIYGKVAATKSIPDVFYGLPERQVALLIGALWSTDGSIHVGNHERLDKPIGLSERNDIKYYSTSRELCIGIQHLLLRMDIQSTVTGYEIEYNKAPYPVWVVRIIGAESKRVFCNKVQSVGKDHYLDQVIFRLDHRDDTSYPSQIIPKNSKAVMNNGKKRYSSQIHNKQTVSKFVAVKFAKEFESVQKHTSGDILWERVVSKNFHAEEMTYDLEVPIHHSFVVDGIITHNTSTALNYAYNNAMVYEKNIFYAILEMPYKQLRRQIYVLHSAHGKFITDWYQEDRRRGVPEDECYRGIDYRKVRDGELRDIELERFKKVAQDFKANAKGKIYVWRPEEEATMSDIKRRAEMFHNKYGCDGIIIDYLGLVKPKYRSNDHVVSINNVVREGRLLALNFARGKTIPVLALFQMNRQGKMRADKADGRYDFAAISYANGIEKDADVITYTYLNDQLRKEGKFYLGNLKNRDNPIFERMVGKILWQSKRMRSMDIGTLDMDNKRMVENLNMISDMSVEDLF